MNVSCNNRSERRFAAESISHTYCTWSVKLKYTWNILVRTDCCRSITVLTCSTCFSDDLAKISMTSMQTNT